MSPRHICRPLTRHGGGVVAGRWSLSTDGSCPAQWRGAREGEGARVPQEDGHNGRWLPEDARCPTLGQRHLQVRDANILCFSTCQQISGTHKLEFILTRSHTRPAATNTH